MDRFEHVGVRTATLDTMVSNGGLFPTQKGAAATRHSWNFNVIQNNQNNVLKQLGHLPGMNNLF